MAYLKSIVEQCRWHGCSSRATVELYHRVNANLGKYCNRHGALAEKEQQKTEGAHGR